MKWLSKNLSMSFFFFLFVAGFSLFYLTSVSSNAPLNDQGGSSGGGGAGINW